MNIVIYARFSSHSQTEQSIEGQLKVCREYAAANGHIVVGEYIDRAQTGFHRAAGYGVPQLYQEFTA